MVLSVMDYPKQNTRSKYPYSTLHKLKYSIICDKCSSKFERLYVNRINSVKKCNGADMCRTCSLEYQYLTGNRKSHFSDMNSKNKGKPFEDLYGVEKSNKLKQQLSIKNSGENNPNYGGKHNHGFVDNPICGPIQEYYGKEKADSLRAVRSANATGNKNPMYGKPSPTGSGNGWSGWYKHYFFRSILELSYLVYLDSSDIYFETAEAKEYRISYIKNNTDRTYHPDFVIGDKIIEVKPKKLINTIDNQLKFAAAKLRYGDKFIIITEDDIPKLSDDEVYKLYDNNLIQWTDRYKIKFNERRHPQ